MKSYGELPCVSVIIPTYNRSSLLKQTIESFLIQSYPHELYEIIVADNNSSDDTKQIIIKHFANQEVSVKYLFEKRQGVHYARNSAAMIAKGEILYFTDDDMIADQNLLSELVSLLCKYPDVGCATGLILPRFFKPIPQWVEKYMWNGLLSLTERDKPEELIISKNDMVYSCHQAIRRDVFFKAGGFNPENTAGVWIGDGETGLNIKIKKLGYKFGYTSKSIIYHIIPPERMTQAYLNRRLENQGNCDSYTAYREFFYSKAMLVMRIGSNVLQIVLHILYMFKNILLLNSLWRVRRARISYYKSRVLYDIRLLCDNEWRALVLKDNWLNE